MWRDQLTRVVLELSEQVCPVDQDEPACHPVGRDWPAEVALERGGRVLAKVVGDHALKVGFYWDDSRNSQNSHGTVTTLFASRLRRANGSLEI